MNPAGGRVERRRKINTGRQYAVDSLHCACAPPVPGSLWLLREEAGESTGAKGELEESWRR